MGKWFFITVLSLFFSGFAARGIVSGNTNAIETTAHILKKNAGPDLFSPRFVTSVVPPQGVNVNSHNKNIATFSNAGGTTAASRLLPSQLLAPDAGFSLAQWQLVNPVSRFSLLPGQFAHIQIRQPAQQSVLLKDHFHHLFPFFHFW